MSSDGTIQTLHTTNGHPFYVSMRGWTAAAQLEIGDPVFQDDGVFGHLIESSETLCKSPVPVFNFEVDQLHNYFVSERPGQVAFLVHNDCYTEALHRLAVAQEGSIVKMEATQDHMQLGYKEAMQNHALYLDKMYRVHDRYVNGVPWDQWLQQYMQANNLRNIQELTHYVNFSTYTPLGIELLKQRYSM